MNENQSIGPELAMNAFDDIPKAKSDAKDIVGLVKAAAGLPAISFPTAIPSPRNTAWKWPKTEKSRASVSPIVKTANT